MKVEDIMSRSVISVGPDEPVAAAARLLQRHDLGALPVCDGAGRLRGFVTDRDIVLRCVALDGDAASLPVREIMSRGIVTAGTEESVETVSSRMARSQLRRLPVTADGRVVGMVTLCDLARRPDCGRQAAEALSGISANIRTL